MSVTGQEGRQSSEWSDTDEFTAVSDLFAKKKRESWKTKGGWEEEDEFTIDKLLFPWSYE